MSHMWEVARIVDLVFKIFSVGLILRIAFTWANPRGTWKVQQVLGAFYDPILEPLRRLIPTMNAGEGVRIDFTPALLLLLLWFIVHPLLMRVLL